MNKTFTVSLSLDDCFALLHLISKEQITLCDKMADFRIRELWNAHDNVRKEYQNNMNIRNQILKSMNGVVCV